ncbi:hypothetical protein [Microlunatus ginsengisoli]|uniref:Secreted protein n=1 Tax=Microlunatus ginsengisoli TaxID=363863 RepID=A0ABP7AYJ2_9ACTN
MIITVFLLNAVLVLAILIALGARHALRRLRYRRSAVSAPPAAIFDAGRSVHLVPDSVEQHVIDESGECWCHPQCCLSRRASGSLIVFVDHVARRRVT